MNVPLPSNRTDAKSIGELRVILKNLVVSLFKFFKMCAISYHVYLVQYSEKSTKMQFAFTEVLGKC